MAHELRLLTKLGNARVEQCSCGAIHISIGATTVRLNEKNALDLQRALASAAPQFQTQDDTVTAASSQSASPSDPESGGASIERMKRKQLH